MFAETMSEEAVEPGPVRELPPLGYDVTLTAKEDAA
jgi:hypothetical protein